MFKGIISSIGTITSIVERADLDKCVHIEAQNLSSIKVGDSIACSGVCLTVVNVIGQNSFTVGVSKATLTVTNISHWCVRTKINLEQAMRLSDRIDGHLVQGHIDDVATIIAIEKKTNSHEIKLNCPPELAKFIVKKGSVALDGVSLTVNSLEEQEFSINIIPYTWDNTTFKYNNVNDKVNLEIDLIAKYIDKYLKNK